jgi:ribosome modulation factor
MDGLVLPLLFERRKEMNKEYAHKMGYDCGKNGANLKNCHFTIFSRREFTKAWEEGKRKAESKQALKA